MCVYVLVYIKCKIFTHCIICKDILWNGNKDFTIQLRSINCLFVMNILYINLFNYLYKVKQNLINMRIKKQLNVMTRYRKWFGT